MSCQTQITSSLKHKKGILGNIRLTFTNGTIKNSHKCLFCIICVAVFRKLHGNSVYVTAWSEFACWEAGTRNYRHLRGWREASLAHDSISIIYRTEKKRRTQWIHKCVFVCAQPTRANSHESRFLQKLLSLTNMCILYWKLRHIL